MIDYNRNSTRYTTDGSYFTTAIWKPNHVVFGKAHTAGCWVTRRVGRSTFEANGHRATIDLWGAKLSGLTAAEWLELCDVSDELRFTLHIVESQVYFFDPQYNKITVAADKVGRAQVRGAIERIAADRKKPVPKPKSEQKADKRAAAIARTRALGLLSEPVAPVADPLIAAAQVLAAPQPVKSEPLNDYSNAPEVKNGVPVELVPAFRAWLSQNHEAIQGTKQKERVAKFKASRATGKQPAAPFFESVPFANAHEIDHGLPPEQVPAFREWMKGLRGAFKQMPLSAKIEAFLTGGDAEDWEVVLTDPAPQPVEEKPAPVILHDAHVFAYRRRRANRLKALRRQVVREGQGRFRTCVLANYEGCAVTRLTDGIEAAHVIPDALLDDMRPANGLPLVGFLHSAFDSLLFSIDPITLAVSVAPVAREWLNIEGVIIEDGKIWPLDRSALGHHFERFKEAHSI